MNDRSSGGERTAVARLGYRPALDGIRGCAILAVLAYHGGTPLKGGFIGVDIFFVLSGFLITTLLLQEWETKGSIALGDFYARRARRLLPALFLTVAAVGVIYAVDPSLNGGVSFLAAAAGVIFYAGNWIDAFATNPIQVLGLLDHTWSLAIEEQFYILWPALLIFSLRRRWRSARLVFLLVGLAAASSVLRALLWWLHIGGHVYFRSDTRADGILLGCALAAARWNVRGHALAHRLTANSLITLLAVAGLIAFAFTTAPNDAFVFLGGLSLVALCSSVVIGHVVFAGGSWFTRLLTLRPLVWIGARSYGIYLFHIPIFSVVAATSLNAEPGRIVLPFDIAVTMVVAAMSYHWLESYFLRRRRLPGAPPHVQRAPVDRDPAALSSTTR